MTNPDSWDGVTPSQDGVGSQVSENLPPDYDADIQPPLPDTTDAETHEFNPDGSPRFTSQEKGKGRAKQQDSPITIDDDEVAAEAGKSEDGIEIVENGADDAPPRGRKRKSDHLDVSSGSRKRKGSVDLDEERVLSAYSKSFACPICLQGYILTAACPVCFCAPTQAVMTLWYAPSPNHFNTHSHQRPRSLCPMPARLSSIRSQAQICRTT